MDGSIQWVLIDAWLSADFQHAAFLEIREIEPSVGDKTGVTVEQTSSGFTVNTGPARFQLTSERRSSTTSGATSPVHAFKAPAPPPGSSGPATLTADIEKARRTDRNRADSQRIETPLS
jgi:hypothetical protein